MLQGARPVFADIDPRTYNLDPGRIGERITSRTKAILPVHLFGHPADMAPILALAQERKLRVIEDAAQAVGARYRGQCAGTLGDIGCLSFYPAKHLGACGDGGALLTNDPELARKCRMIGLHGSEQRYRHEFPGLNSRLDSLQAAILKVKLPHLESWIERRIQIAKAYDRALEPLPSTPPYCAPGVRHVYNQYSIRSPRRDRLAEFLRARGVDCAIHYPLPLHLQPAYRTWAARQRVVAPRRGPCRRNPFPTCFSGINAGRDGQGGQRGPRFLEGSERRSHRRGDPREGVTRVAGLGCWPREGPPARGTAVGNHQSGQRNTGAQEDCADSEDADQFRPHGGQGEASVARGRRASGQQRLDHRRIAVVSGCPMQRRSLPGTTGLGTGSGTKANFHSLDRCRPEKYVRVPHPAILRRQNRGTALAEQNFGNGHIICLFGQMQRHFIPHRSQS